LNLNHHKEKCPLPELELFLVGVFLELLLGALELFLVLLVELCALVQPLQHHRTGGEHMPLSAICGEIYFIHKNIQQEGPEGPGMLT